MIVSPESKMMYVKKIDGKWYTQGASLFFTEPIDIKDNAIIFPFNLNQIDGIYQVFKTSVIDDSSI